MKGYHLFFSLLLIFSTQTTLTMDREYAFKKSGVLLLLQNWQNRQRSLQDKERISRLIGTFLDSSNTNDKRM